MQKHLKKCIGCGVDLQNEDKEVIGYTPKSLEEDNNDYCQRCFQLKNYSKYSENTLTREDYRKEVYKLIDDVDLVLAIFDIIDFEGSFDDEILDVLREKDSIVVINKVDLVPSEKHPSEVAYWVKARLEEEGIVPLDIAIVSSKNTYGISGIYKKINHFFPNGVKAMVIGVTNVGKSSIINRLMGENKVTVSKYPGTTIKNIENKIKGTNIILYDTPGLIPQGRISDLVCDKCSLKLVASSEITRKTFKGDESKVIMLANLVSIRVKNIQDFKPVFSIFASKDVAFHETNLKKAEELSKNNFFEIPCQDCLAKYKEIKKITKIFTIDSGYELTIKGLGWLTVKRGPMDIELTYPENTEINLRKSFIKPKR